MTFDPQAYNKLVKWLDSNSGQIFKVKEYGEFQTYFDNLGRERAMKVAPAKDWKKLQFHLKYHIENRGKPSVIFLNQGYLKFKIWDEGDNFFNYPMVYQERKMISIK